MGMASSTTRAFMPIYLSPTMRGTPTLLALAGAWGLTASGGSTLAVTAISVGAASPRCMGLLVDVASGLVAGNATMLFSNNDANAKLMFDARL